jgi:hypothetical protein
MWVCGPYIETDCAVLGFLILDYVIVYITVS